MTSLTDEEISRLVAEKILGAKINDSGTLLQPITYPRGTILHVAGFDPINDPAHSDMIIDKMVEDGFDVTINYRHVCFGEVNKHWICYFKGEDGPWGEDESRQRAIALAALAAKGVEV